VVGALGRKRKCNNRERKDSRKKNMTGRERIGRGGIWAESESVVGALGRKRK
jgi:hypothetical protein